MPQSNFRQEKYSAAYYLRGRGSVLAVDVVGDALHDHVERHKVVPALEHDDVGVLAAGLDKLLVHGLDGGEVLRDHALERAATVADVAAGAAQDAHVCVGLHEDLDVEQLAQRSVLEDQDALDDDHLVGLDLHSLVGAVVLNIGVHGALDALPVAQLLEVLDEQRGVERVWMVVVDLGALLIGLALLALIVVVVADDGHLIAEMLLEMARECGLARAGAPGDADKHGAHMRVPPVVFSSPL